jgi:hemolysin activation/secretion protein
VSYPFTRYHRVDAGAGFVSRNFFFPIFFDADGDGDVEEQEVVFEERNDNAPIVSTSFSGDSAVWKFFGPVSGRRYQMSVSYQPDLKEGGALTTDVTLDWREYRQITSRSLLAARVYTALSEGNTPNFHYFGGLNTLRGYDFRTLLGQYAAFANFELRFPLVDLLATPVFAFQQMRGVIFFDVGAAYFKDEPFNFMENGRLVDGKASIGWGLSFQFMGLPLNWDFAKRFDGKTIEGGYRTSFWIGQTF